MQSDRELMQQALEALERCVATCFDQRAYEQVMSRPEHFVNQNITALRERLARCDTCGKPLGGDGHIHTCSPQRLAQPEQEPVAHSIVAGALFDFMGWLTTRRERLVLSGADDAAPAADAIKHFARMRSLTINDAQVQKWQEHLATPPRREWQGLTDEEVDGVKHTFDWASPWTLADFARAIEAKLREKNA